MRTDRPRRFSRGPCLQMRPVASGPSGTRKWCCAKGRLRATTRRRTRRAGRRSFRPLRAQLERGSLVCEEPTLHLQQVAAGRVAEAAQAVRGDDAMAGDDDRQAVVAARLADGARVRADLARELAVSARAAARNRAHRNPHATLQFGALDQQRQVELPVRVLAIALELPCRTFRQGIGGSTFRSRRRQKPHFHNPLRARSDAHLHLRELDDYVEHSFSICAIRSSGTSMPFFAEASAAKRRVPGRRTSGSASMVETMVSVLSQYLFIPAKAAGSMAMNAWPMRGLLPSSEKNESASEPIADPVSAAQISSNISASIAPFAPPMGNRLPCSI